MTVDPSTEFFRWGSFDTLYQALQNGSYKNLALGAGLLTLAAGATFLVREISSQTVYAPDGTGANNLLVRAGRVTLFWENQNPDSNQD